MVSLASYVIVFFLACGLVVAKPVAERLTTGNVAHSQSLQQAEQILNRYSHLIQSDTDHLIHALFAVLLKHPKSFTVVPHPALDIALKNVADKLDQDAANALTKPMLLAIEQHALKKTKQSATYQLTDEVKSQIEDALDQFFREQGVTSSM